MVVLLGVSGGSGDGCILTISSVVILSSGNAYSCAIRYTVPPDRSDRNVDLIAVSRSWAC